MSKLLILGASPLPFESALRSYGPGTRTWQLTEPLQREGHQVHLVTYRIPGTYPEETAAEVSMERGNLVYTSLSGPAYFESPAIQRIHDRLLPDAVIFAHASVSFQPTVLTSEAPFWIDLCGHVMAEAQAKAAVYRDDSFLDPFFERVVALLARGDVFSTVSEAQSFAVIGELGLMGRLNAATDGHRLVHCIPCGAEEEDYEHELPVFRGREVPDDAFVVLWSGGFNTWTDVETLFGGLVHAMARDPSITFVATGGQIDGHDELTYPEFEHKVRTSAYAKRFLLRGWIPREQVPSYYYEADVGINCEKDIYEVRMGSKHRILDWSRAALPVVSTRVTEISEFLEAERLGFVCDPGSAAGLGEAILRARRAHADLGELGRRFQRRIREVYGFAATTRELRAWAREPAFAPDTQRMPRGLEKWSATILSAAPAGNLPEPSRSEARPENESTLAWLRRVLTTSWRQGGLSLVFLRARARLLGRRHD